jgi:hypothetical protein
MTRYLISFDDGAMDFIPEEEGPAVTEASHAVIRDAQDAGVWVFAGGGVSPRRGEREGGGPQWDGHRRRGEQGVHRRSHDHRRALTRGGAAVGRQARRRLPLCTRGPRVRARPGRRQLIEGASPAPVFGHDA